MFRFTTPSVFCQACARTLSLLRYASDVECLHWHELPCIDVITSGDAVHVNLREHVPDCGHPEFIIELCHADVDDEPIAVLFSHDLEPILNVLWKTKQVIHQREAARPVAGES